MKRALITGISGQDGAYLAEFLLNLGYEVFGSYRRTSTINFWRLEELSILEHVNLHLIEYDLTDQSNAIRVISEIQPHEIYNLAALSFVASSFIQPVATSNITGLGVLHLLEAIRIVNPKIKFYQASSSEMFGKVQEIPQTEGTSFYPRSPYGIAKLYAHWMVVNYRESYNLFACSGILFNHESPLRGKEFVTRKITNSVAKIKLGKLDVLELGNLDAKRDWGYAKEYVEGMYLMLQQAIPDTFVLATNRSVSVREFLIMAFKVVDIDLEFSGVGVDEIAIDKSNNKILVKINPIFYRPTEVDILIGSADKAQKILNWEAKYKLEDLCREMVIADLKRNKNAFKF